MASIGPQIPSHLLAHSRTSTGRRSHSPTSDNGESQSVPSKATVIGPQIPVLQVNIDDNDDNDDAYGPALPPDLVSSRTESQPDSTAGPSKLLQARRVIGPSLPGHDPSSHDDGSEGDDSDGYGPMPLSVSMQRSDSVSEGVREFMEKEEKRQKEIEEAAKPKQLKRDEWMLAPPSSSDILGHLGDPLKLKARQFSRGGSSASRSAPNNLWTETPAERQQRIADEVAGKKKRAANADPDADLHGNAEDNRRKRRRDEELRKVVEEHNKTSRNKSLLEMHADTEAKSKSKKSKEDDESHIIWDHARDMSLGGKLMDEKQRSKLISDAKSLGDRFGGSKAGGYL